MSFFCTLDLHWKKQGEGMGGKSGFAGQKKCRSEKSVGCG